MAKYSPMGFEVLGSHLGTSSNSEWVYDIKSPHICHQWHSRFCKKNNKKNKKTTLYQNLGEPRPGMVLFRRLHTTLNQYDVVPLSVGDI